MLKELYMPDGSSERQKKKMSKIKRNEDHETRDQGSLGPWRRGDINYKLKLVFLAARPIILYHLLAGEIYLATSADHEEITLIQMSPPPIRLLELSSVISTRILPMILSRIVLQLHN